MRTEWSKAGYKLRLAQKQDAEPYFRNNFNPLDSETARLTEGDFLCFRLVLFQKLRTEVLQSRNCAGITSLLIVSVNARRTTVNDRLLLCSEVCAADKLFTKGHNELGF